MGNSTNRLDPISVGVVGSELNFRIERNCWESVRTHRTEFRQSDGAVSVCGTDSEMFNIAE